MEFTIEEMGKLYQFPNLAKEEFIDEEAMNKMGMAALRGYEEDKASISDWTKEIEDVRELAAQKATKKTYPWDGASNVKYPLITVAALQFNARAYPTILNNNNIALARVIGKDEDGQKAARAERISRHMSAQLTEEMEDWESNMDRLLSALPIDGVCFKKIYNNSVERKNAADYVSATDLIVNNSTVNLKTAPRISMLMSLYPYEIQERISSGIFTEWRTMEEDETTQEPVDFIEQHCRYDLDGDGYPEPYIVTLTLKGGKVVRIVANYREENILTDGGDIIKIDATQYFVKYECFPDPQGGFYSRGFGMLLKPISESIDSILNQLIDAGHLSNTGGGFLAKGFRVQSGQLRFSPGEWKKVDISGMSLKDGVLPLPIREPSGVLFSLLGMLVDAGKQISSIQEVMTGGGGQNTPATTVLALIEQGMKVYTAIFKRIYRSLKEELKLLYDLNRLYLDDETYDNILDEKAAVKADYEDKSFDIRPAADPSMATDIQKAAKSQLLTPFLHDPFFNGPKIAEDLLESAGFSHPNEYLAPPKQGPDPMEQLAMQKEAADMELRHREQNRKDKETQAKIQDMDVKQYDILASAFKKMAETDELGGDNLLNAKELEAIKRFKEIVDEQRGISGVERSEPMVLPNTAGPTGGIQ